MVPGDQAIQVVAVGPVASEGLFVEKALNAAAHANLVRTVLNADGPAHLTVPAAPKNDDGSASDPGCKYAQRPQPTPFWLAFTHYREPRHPYLQDRPIAREPQ